METQALINRIHSMQTVADLAKLLNAIKTEQLGWVSYGISEKMLKHYSADSIAPKRFRTFKIRKKRGGFREIKAPCAQLHVILSCINTLLKNVYTPSTAAMGFTEGRSVVSNANVHVGHNYVFNIDLKDFFPSIPQARVWKRLQLPPFNFTKQVADVVAGLCCSHDAEKSLNVLPQGSPTSPLLTNAICDTLDRRMKGVAKRFGLHYTRYADDMTFSSMHNVYHEDGEFRKEISRIITEQGFRMNESKTRLQKPGTRQEVTGLTVNALTNVSHKYISDLRWIISVWEKEGYAKAYARFYPKYKYEKGYIKKGEPVMEHVIGGKLDYLRMVRGDDNLAYRKLADRYAALQELVFVDNETDTSKSYVYVQPYTLADFQTLFNTSISLKVSSRGKLAAKCEIGGREKILSVSKSTQTILCPDLSLRAPDEEISSPELASCFVTLCQSKGKNFWLITKHEPKRSRCLSIQNLKVDPEELLTLWEQEGIENAVRRFESFLRYGKPGESISETKSEAETDNSSAIDRGIIRGGREMLIRYFLKHRRLTASHKSRLARLLTPLGQNTPSDIEALLTLWENDGLDAAVSAWKALTPKAKIKSVAPTGSTGLSEASAAIAATLDSVKISNDTLKALQEEVVAGTGEISDIEFDWDEIEWDNLSSDIDNTEPFLTL